MTSINRRRALTGSAALAVGVPLVAACGDAGSTQTGSDGAASSGGAAEGGAGTGEALASVADVPVDGCFVLADVKVVVTQPSEGQFKAFSATCTHQGCLVSSGSDGVIPCQCHGSKFSLSDGSVIAGPATSPLPEVAISVDGDSISRA